MGILTGVDVSGIVALLERAPVEGVTPGGCFAIGTADSCSFCSFGQHFYSPAAHVISLETVWDLASLTKVVGTTTAAMLLLDAGVLELDRPVASILPQFAARGKEAITVRQLLLHNSGLTASLGNSIDLRSAQEGFEAVWNQPLVYAPGSATVYSDVGFIALGRVIEELSGQPLDEFFKARIWDPLDMEDTTFFPDQALCAPTEPIEPWRRRLRPTIEGDWIIGEVHDPTAAVMGGVAGHAGLFSTVIDLAKFMQFMLNKGSGLVSPETVDLFVRRGSASSSRALGWDTPSDGSSAGNRLGPRSFGHTGFTGTSLWADPDRGIFAVLLTNRVHPTATNLKIKELRIAFHDVVVGALST